MRQYAHLLRAAGLPTARPWALSRRPRLQRCTFDVFDTLLARTVLRDEAVWSEVGRVAWDDDLVTVKPHEYVHLRDKARRQAGRGGRPPTFEDIIEALSQQPAIGRRGADRLARLELGVEVSMIRGVPAGQELLEAARASGPTDSVVFISDMHLPSGFIRDQLIEHGCWKEGDVLWVSGEAGVRKADATLFTLVASQEASSPHVFVHVGDADLGDHKAARWAGFRAQPFTECRPNRYERRLDEFGASTNSLSTWMAGIARQTRLELPTDAAAPVVTATQRIAAGVAGPVLTNYCLWLLARAAEHRLDRIYFVSRDGEILWQITRILADALALSIELRYLYGGRLAWQLPALAIDPTPDAIASRVRRSLSDYTIVRPSGLAARLGLETSELVRWMSLDLGDSTGVAGAPLGRLERRKIEAILTSDDGIQIIREAASRALPLTLDYLRQEGLFERDSRWALADVGWGGSTVRALDLLLRSRGGKRTRAFFLGYTGEAGDGRLAACDAFMWDSELLAQQPRPRGAVAIVEAICSGSHGPVAGYQRGDGGAVRPVLLSDKSRALERWCLAEFRAVLTTYAENLAVHLRPNHLATVDPRAPLAVLTDLCERPTTAEAVALGACPREEDAQGDSVFPLARAFRLRDLPNLVLPGPLVGRNLAWRGGAIALTRAPTRPILRAVLAVSDSLRGLSDRDET